MQRYWDGQGWTTHVAPIESQPPYAGPPTYAGPPAYPTAPPYAGQSYGAPPTTPDGAPLAGWWHRVGAYLIDFVILIVIVTLLALPLLLDIFGGLGDYIERAMTAAENGDPPPPTEPFERDITTQALLLGGISVVVGFVYTVAFLMWKQATPGKLAVGLRVRLRDRPELPLSAVLLRWATQSGVPGVLGLVPFVGVLASIFGFLDVLWPLWDEKNQAIHDKVAKTNVVRVR